MHIACLTFILLWPLCWSSFHSVPPCLPPPPPIRSHFASTLTFTFHSFRDAKWCLFILWQFSRFSLTAHFPVPVWPLQTFPPHLKKIKIEKKIIMEKQSCGTKWRSFKLACDLFFHRAFSNTRCHQWLGVEVTDQVVYSAVQKLQAPLKQMLQSRNVFKSISNTRKWTNRRRVSGSPSKQHLSHFQLPPIIFPIVF